MNIKENIRLAWVGLVANKMRALLTMLGIIIGITSVIGILTIGNGLSGSVSSSMSSLGATNITIQVKERDDKENDMARNAMLSTSTSVEEENRLTDEMITDLKNKYRDEIKGISLTESVGNAKATLERDYANVTMTGINSDYITVNSIDLIKGRDFLDKDIEGKRNVVLVSDKLVNNLYHGDSEKAIGQELVVNMNNEIFVFNIVGVYQYVESSFGGGSMSSEKDITTSLYLPITTAKKISGSDPGYSGITISASTSVDSAEFALKAEEFLNKYYVNNDDYHVTAMSMESMLDSLNTMMNTISIALSVIAGISLLVGGIGVMNIMLVSVTERTREIGTRKALGATNKNIQIQFVTESMIICLIGGIIGIILGGVVGYIGTSIIGQASFPTVSSVVLAAGFSLVIGVFFGYYPADKAAKLDPIEALRYE